MWKLLKCESRFYVYRPLWKWGAHRDTKRILLSRHRFPLCINDKNINQHFDKLSALWCAEII